jgi:molecular chaperone DnaK
VPQIEVTFDIDANGIVNVTARDQATGKEQTITISGSSGLSKDEVDRMVKEAEANAAVDQARRDTIDARNQADTLIYSVEKTYTESKAKLAADAASRVESALEAAKQAVKGDEPAAIRAATTELQQVSHAMAQALYQASGAGPQAPGARPQAPDGQPDVKEGEVVEGEYAETR